MALGILWLQFAAASVVLVIASTFLARSAEVISTRTGLGRSLVGVTLLAAVTSLPELGAGVSSVALADAPDLAAGAAFGSNLANLMKLGLLDIFSRNGLILHSVSPTSVVQAGLGIVVISLAVGAILLHGNAELPLLWHVSPISLLLVASFFLAMYILFRSDHPHEQVLLGGDRLEPW